MRLWKHLYSETLKEYVKNKQRYNTVPNRYHQITSFFFIWLSHLNSNFILLADFPFMRPFQMPYLSELHYYSIYKCPVSISFIYYSNFENSSK